MQRVAFVLKGNSTSKNENDCLVLQGAEDTAVLSSHPNFYVVLGVVGINLASLQHDVAVSVRLPIYLSQAIYVYYPRHPLPINTT
jgi:hypothetical protein